MEEIMVASEDEWGSRMKEWWLKMLHSGGCAGLNMAVGWWFRGGLKVAIVRFMVEVGVAC